MDRGAFWILDNKRVHFGAAASRYLTVLCRRVGSRQLTFLLILFFLLSFCGTLSVLTLFSDSSSFCSFSRYSMSLPSSFCVSAPPTSSRPPLLFLSFPLGSGAKVGWQTEANTAQGRAEGDPKAGELIMCMSVFLTPLLLASSRV